MSDPSRIDPTAAPAVSYPPAAGGWTPSFWLHCLLSLLAGVAAAVGHAMTQGGSVTPAMVVGSALTGFGAAGAAYAGMASAGPRKLDQ